MACGTLFISYFILILLSRAAHQHKPVFKKPTKKPCLASFVLLLLLDVTDCMIPMPRSTESVLQSKWTLGTGWASKAPVGPLNKAKQLLYVNVGWAYGHS